MSRALAAAPLDDVLALWSGLGYYARARNLHAAAKVCVERHGGELPRDLDALIALPGIGRSTAGAILRRPGAIASAILDGNVKRVLARIHGIDGWPGLPAVEKQLWAIAEAHLPDARLADYTQAQMDFGATLCTRARSGLRAVPAADRLRRAARRPRRRTADTETRQAAARTQRTDAVDRRRAKAACCCSAARRPASGRRCGRCPNTPTTTPRARWFAAHIDADFDPAETAGARSRTASRHYRLQIQPLRWRGVRTPPRAVERQ